MQYRVNETTPDHKVIAEVAKRLKNGHVAIYPTDSLYGMGSALSHHEALIKILRQMGREKSFSDLSLLVCDIEQANEFVQISTPDFRRIKSEKEVTTWILPAKELTFKRMKLPKRQTVGIRICKHPVVEALIRELKSPLISASLEERDPEYWHYGDPDEVVSRFSEYADLLLLAGYVVGSPSQVIDLSQS